MAVLKKIRAASLIESLTASVIIVVVFMIASLSFNNVFQNIIKSDTALLKNRLSEITYFTKNNKINFPFYEEAEYWIISGESRGGKAYFDIENLRTGKSNNLIIILD